MTLPSDASETFLSLLMVPAIRTLLLAGATGLGLSVFRVKATSLRLFTWSGVLYAALAMPFLGWMLPSLPVSTPAFLQYAADRALPSNSRNSQPAFTAPTPVTNNTSVAIYEATGRKSDARARGQTASAAFVGSSRFWSSIPWGSLVIGIYFAGTMLLLARIVVGLVFTRRLLHASHAIQETRLNLVLLAHVRVLGLARVPVIAESKLVSVPVTLGAFRSTVLIPADWREWDDAKLNSVIAHELSHVAWHDALTQRLSLLHRAIFWFSPLAWWLDRHLADLAEQASDEAVLSCGADRNEYARALLEFFSALQTTPGRVWWQGVSMAKAGQAEQRLERIFAWRGVTMNLKKSVSVIIIALTVPAVYLAASIRPVSHGPSSQELEGGQNQAEPGTERVAPVVPVEQHAALTPVTSISQSHKSASSVRHGNSYTYGYDDEQRFVIISGNGDSVAMSGTSEDVHHAQKLKKQIQGDFIWFERDEKSYLIRDQATIDRARKLWAPQEELGRQQEELGKKMEEVRVEVPDMTAQLDKLRAEMKQLGPSATMDQIGKLQSEIGELQSRIGEIQSHAGEQQGKLGEEMGALGEKQGKLGEQQGELGRKQGELAEKASREMKVILDEAISKGTAQPEP